jgi:hypothetical protein
LFCLLSGCNIESIFQIDTPIPPTETPVPPTETPVPPTETPIPPTATETPIPPTPTAIPVDNEIISVGSYVIKIYFANVLQEASFTADTRAMKMKGGGNILPVAISLDPGSSILSISLDLLSGNKDNFIEYAPQVMDQYGRKFDVFTFYSEYHSHIWWYALVPLSSTDFVILCPDGEVINLVPVTTIDSFREQLEKFLP